MTSTATTTYGVDLTITADLYPEGTVYGGGPETYRYPDAEPVEDTQPRTMSTTLAELGSTGTAIQEAMNANLLHIVTDGERVDESHDDWNGEPVDRYVFEGSMTVDQWRAFADTYLIELDEDGTPSRGEYAGDTEPTALPDGSTIVTRSFEDYSGSMDWNVGGLSKVSSARVEVTLWTLTADA